MLPAMLQPVTCHITACYLLCYSLLPARLQPVTCHVTACYLLCYSLLPAMLQPVTCYVTACYLLCYSLLLTKSKLEEMLLGPEEALTSCRQMMKLWKEIHEIEDEE